MQRWAPFMQAYLRLLLDFWAVRRAMTRGSSAVSVQIALELLTTLKIRRRLALEGKSHQRDLHTAIAFGRHARSTPYFVSQIASITQLDVSRVRRMCRNLATHARVHFINADSLTMSTDSGSDLKAIPLGMYSKDLKDLILRFVNVTAESFVECTERPMTNVPVT